MMYPPIKEPNQISREQANEIMREHIQRFGHNTPQILLTAVYKGQWYDVRGMDEGALAAWYKNVDA